MLISCMSKFIETFFQYTMVFFSILENLIGKGIRNLGIAGLVY